MSRSFLVGMSLFIVFITPALALNVTVSTDKSRVVMGENITLTGKITDDNGTAGVFQYRATVVAPKGILVCDSNRTSTASDGTFTLRCKIPTADEANALGVPAALSRSVIPYKAGVAVKVDNQTLKRHAKEIIAVNPDKLNRELDNLIRGLENFINHTTRFLPECDNIAEKVARYNLTDITSRCLEIQAKINDMIANATAIADRAREIRANSNVSSLEDFRESLRILKESQKDLRGDLKEIKDGIKNVRWDKVKEINRDADEIRDDIAKKRVEISKARAETKETRNRTMPVGR